MNKISPESYHSTDRVEVVSGLVRQGLVEIDARYGPNGAEPLEYHNLEHTLDHLGASVNIARLAYEGGKITLRQLDLVPLNSTYHDYFQGLDGEMRSARTLSKRMRLTGAFSQDEIEESQDSIMGTTFKIIDNVIQQSPRPNSYLSQINADADMATLGRPSEIFWDRAFKLYLEKFFDKSLNRPPTNEEILEFAITQEPFLRGHKYYTPEAETIYHNKPANISYVKELIVGLSQAA